MTGAAAPVVISLSNDAYYDVFLDWAFLSASDQGTLMDFYMDTAKANAMARSFYWAHPVDGHTYVAQFISEFTSVWVAGWGTNQKAPGFILRVFGRKAD